MASADVPLRAVCQYSISFSPILKPITGRPKGDLEMIVSKFQDRQPAVILRNTLHLLK